MSVVMHPRTRLCEYAEPAGWRPERRQRRARLFRVVLHQRDVSSTMRATMALTVVLGMNQNVSPVRRVTRMPLVVSSDLSCSAKSGGNARQIVRTALRYPRVEGRGAAVAIGLARLSQLDGQNRPSI